MYNQHACSVYSLEGLCLARDDDDDDDDDVFVCIEIGLLHRSNAMYIFQYIKMCCVCQVMFPSRQNQMCYGGGGDIERGWGSGENLYRSLHEIGVNHIKFSLSYSLFVH